MSSIKEDGSISNIETTSTLSTFSSNGNKGRFFLIDRLGKIEDDLENFDPIFPTDVLVKSIEREKSESDSEITINDKDRIRVVVRVRPKNAYEYQNDNREIIKFYPNGLTLEGKSFYRRFVFDAVLDPTSSQEDVFKISGIKRLINMAIEGFVFSFKQLDIF